MNSPVLLAYVGPETILPILSVFTAIVGAIMIGWRYIVAMFSRSMRFLLRRKGESRTD